MTLLAPDPFEVAADLLDPPEHPYAGDIPGWVQSNCDETLTRDQEAIANAIQQHRYVAVQSCHDVGKSFTAARIAVHWIETHPPGEAFVVTTAPTWSQVKAILWREIARAHRKAGGRGRITEAAEWKLSMGIGPDELVAFGRKPADYDPSAFQGIHARFPLVIVDEAGGVPKPIYDAADSLVTNEAARMLAIGNPDDPASHFAEICKPGSGWHVIRIDALRSPNFTRDAVAAHPKLRALMIREGIPPSTEEIADRLRPMLVSPQWVAERIDRWGLDSPLFMSKVRGSFPEISEDTLIQPGWVVAAQYRELAPEIADARFSVDVARYGTDWSIIGLRQGGHFRVLVSIAKGPTTALVGKVLEAVRAFPSAQVPVNVDDTGVGGGVTDMLVEEGWPTLPLVSNGRGNELLPNGRPRFVDARSEWWWTAREALAGHSGTGADGWIDLDPADDDLAAQLLRPRYGVNRHGQIWVEPKDSMKARGFPSPDRADAFVYSLVREEPVRKPMVGQMVTADLADRNVW